jgi:hypothetical protein
MDRVQARPAWIRGTPLQMRTTSIESFTTLLLDAEYLLLFYRYTAKTRLHRTFGAGWMKKEVFIEDLSWLER